jgi:two-component system, chemotaxis family, protein-glutamate methylesterase/glutaminase
MTHRDIVVIGASAGGVEPLVRIVQSLHATLDAAVFVVVHTSPESTGILPAILSRRSAIEARHGQDGEEILYGRVYVAAPDTHLMINRTGISIMRGPRQNGFRPAVDPLFNSAAETYGPRVIGVILSGALDDGTFGLMTVKNRGGVAIVQHPEEALVPSMPMSAIQHVAVDHIVHSEDIAALLIRTIGQKPAGVDRRPPAMIRERAPSSNNDESKDQHMAPVAPDRMHEPPSPFTCPECGGSLWEFDEGSMPRFRCHTGHGFTAESLLAQQDSKFEVALWSAVRVLQERSALHRQMAERCRGRNLHSAASRYEEQASEEESRAGVLRSFLVGQAQESPARRSG